MSEVIDAPERAAISTELVDLPPKESALAIYSSVGGLDQLIDQIRAKVVGTIYDMKTVKGRSECASDAFKVAKSKTAIEKLGKALSAEYKEIPKKIDAERKRAFDALEALQKEVRQPLTDWEDAEQARVARHKLAIELLEQALPVHDFSSNTIRTTIAAIEMTTVDESWEEFETEGHRVKAKTLEGLQTALATREKYEAEQAELAKLRAESEARRIQDEKDRIAREAAENATRAAEADAKAAQEKAEQDKRDAEERQKQAEARAEAERLASVERAKQAAESARLAEIKRQDDEREAEAAAQRRREADRAHKAKINGAALAAFVGKGLTEECAKKAIVLIAQGVIPAITINY
ncbi:MAG: hypothetical protein EPN62_05615 [Candidimonas sp.]|nr:MAG: hypothetical protein EPN77_16670 [Candidimonas sp.]TAM24786.1 MAG: hypothetical protein EPN62_05615 [Candidimonas sp.]